MELPEKTGVRLRSRIAEQRFSGGMPVMTTGLTLCSCQISRAQKAILGRTVLLRPSAKMGTGIWETMTPGNRISIRVHDCLRWHCTAGLDDR